MMRSGAADESSLNSNTIFVDGCRKMATKDATLGDRSYSLKERNVYSANSGKGWSEFAIRHRNIGYIAVLEVTTTAECQISVC